MADSELVETGMAGSTVTDERTEQSPALPTPPPIFEKLLTERGDVPDAEEPAIHVQGRPTWSFSPQQQSLPVPSLGPPGRRRHPLTVLLASALTLGAFSIVWHTRVNREMSEFDARLDVAPRSSTLGVLVAWLAGLACSLAGAALLIGHQLQAGPALSLASTGFQVAGHLVTWDWLMLAGIVAVPYLTLLIPVSAVAMVMTVERLRVAEERAGLPADLRVRPARHVCLLLLPALGGLLHVAIFQARLNQVWRRAHPAGAPSGG